MIDRIDLRRLQIPLRRTFETSRGATRTLDALLLRVQMGDTVGWGEAHAMPSVTGESQDAVADELAALEPAALDPDDVEATLAKHDDLGPAASAALDGALSDLAARHRAIPVHELIGISPGELPSAATVTLTDPRDAVEQARAWISSGYTRLKIKVGDPGTVLELVDAVREVLPEVREPMPEPEVWIDANEALDLDAALELLPALAEREVALVEQPLPRGDRHGLERLLEATEIPIFVDEPITDPAAVDRYTGLPGRLGVNVKVQKVGGLHRARECVRRAREGDLGVLVGCTIETGLGIAAGAQLVGAADRADLDGNLFLERDPFPLPRPMPGHVGTPSGPGSGVHLDPRFDGLTV